MLLAMLPLSASVAVAWKVMAAPMLEIVPAGGAVMRTTGAVFCLSVMMSCGLPADASRLW